MTEIPSSNQPGDNNSENEPPNRVRSSILWFLVAIIPIPIGLLMDPNAVLEAYKRGQPASLLMFTILSLPCVLIAGIGQSGGIASKGWTRVAAGIFAGLWMGVFDVCVIYFVGCCSAISRIH